MIINKYIYAILAFFLGGLGINYLYAGKVFYFVLCILLCWTFIPSLVGIFSGIFMLCREADENGNLKV